MASKLVAGKSGGNGVAPNGENPPSEPIDVPIATFDPEPFEVIGDLGVAVRPEEDGFVATLSGADISSSGETREEAVENIKDLILMIFQSFEGESDGQLGPAMIRQKHALLNLIRRK